MIHIKKHIREIAVVLFIIAALTATYLVSYNMSSSIKQIGNSKHQKSEIHGVQEKR